MNKEIIHKAYILFLSGVKDKNGIVKVNDNNQIIGIKFLNNSSKNYIVYGYYESGQIRYQKQYKNNKCHGDCVDYNCDGKICYQEYYKNDQLHGDYICYYESGKVRYLKQYKNDKLYGDCIEYYDNGQIKCHYQYKNGELIAQRFNP